MRRKALRDADGLSVDYGVDVPEGCAKGLTGKKAIVSLHVGRLRDIGLDFVADTATHAAIKNMPRPEIDTLQAERVAMQLVMMSRRVWHKKR